MDLDEQLALSLSRELELSDNSKDLVDNTDIADENGEDDHCLLCEFFNTESELSFAFDYVLEMNSESEISEKICEALDYIKCENDVVPTSILKDELVSRELLYMDDEEFYKHNLVRLYRYLHK